jgi:hypothetical protein
MFSTGVAGPENASSNGSKATGVCGACVLHLIVGPTPWLSELKYFVQAAAVWNIGTTGARSRWLAAIPSKCVRMLLGHHQLTPLKR